MPIESILVVDDEPLLRNFLAEILKRRNIQVDTLENGQKAINALRNHSYDLVITDMKLPDITGLDVLKKAKEIAPHIIVIVITAYGSIENAVEAMRLGAFNYLIKPFSPDTLEAVIDKAAEYSALLEENKFLRHQNLGNSPLASRMPKIVANSSSMQAILHKVHQIAKSNASVFITGESGTGKEVIAQAIHYGSQRASHPFIKVNCAAIPDTLIESEFFGHEKGAFTGAHSRRLGRLELAHTGTLLLDEITETPLLLQAKLLRVIQEQEFERVGGSKSVKVDVRFIATTNRNIQEAISNKILREDLYYRLNVVPIHLPPLRERKEDIVPLAEYFIETMNQEYGNDKILSESSQKKLMQYDFPGNIRELANIIERAYVSIDETTIEPEHLFLGENTSSTPECSSSSLPLKLPVGMSLRDLEKEFIIETLAMYPNRRKTAEVLKISERTLRNRLQEYKDLEE